MSANPPATVDKPTGKTTWDPGSGVPTQFFPAGILTAQGQWVPLQGDESGAIIVSPLGAGTPHFDDAQAEVTPGEEQTLIEQTVPVGVTRYLGQVMVITRVTGFYEITAGAEVIGSGRTGPGCDGRMTFTPLRPIPAGTEYQINFTSRLNAPTQSVECYLQASDIASD